MIEELLLRVIRQPAAAASADDRDVGLSLITSAFVLGQAGELAIGPGAVHRLDEHRPAARLQAPAGIHPDGARPMTATGTWWKLAR